jgi:hypothetical protein
MFNTPNSQTLLFEVFATSAVKIAVKCWSPKSTSAAPNTVSLSQGHHCKWLQGNTGPCKETVEDGWDHRQWKEDNEQEQFQVLGKKIPQALHRLKYTMTVLLIWCPMVS